MEPRGEAESSLALLMAGEVGRRDQRARKASLSRSGRSRVLTPRSVGIFGDRDHFRRQPRPNAAATVQDTKRTDP